MSDEKADVCPWCGETVDDAEHSELRGFVDLDGKVSERPWHLACSLRSIAGSVGHQRGTCSCFGGTEEDPPGLTKREGARAALMEFQSKNRVQGAQ